MEKVRFGIVGVGNMGSSHAKSFLGGKVEHGILTAICDLKKERMERICALDGGAELATYTDYRDLFASGKVDAVIVAVPHYFHPQISMDALAAGLHVICEKPEGVYTKQVKELNEAAALLKEESDAKHLNVLCVTVGDERRMEYASLMKLAPDGKVHYLRDLKFKEFFSWLSRSIEKTSQSMSGEEVYYEPTTQWGEILGRA